MRKTADGEGKISWLYLWLPLENSTFGAIPFEPFDCWSRLSISLYLSFEPGIKLFGARIGGRKEKEESMDEEKANEWEIVASFIRRKKRMNE